MILTHTRPVATYWTNHGIGPNTARCIDEGKSLFAAAVVNTLAELLIALLPIPLIALLKLPRRQRNWTITLLCLGFLVVVCGCVRA